MSEIKFKVAADKCTRCGSCVADCPANIITMTDGVPFISTEKEFYCYKCQHCLAICPTGAVSVLGLDPSKSVSLKDAYPSASQMEALIKGRRSVRRYKDENLDRALIGQLLEIAWHAPTGKNDRKVRVTVIDDKNRLAAFREDALKAIERLAQSQKLPPGLERFGDFPKLWAERKIDILFRGAPHLLVTSSPKAGAAPTAYCFIYMAYFELLAQSHGVGTVWDGLSKWTMDLVPDLYKQLGIPDDHQVGYAMVFGKPAVHYARGVQYKQPHIVRVN